MGSHEERGRAPGASRVSAAPASPCLSPFRVMLARARVCACVHACVEACLRSVGSRGRVCPRAPPHLARSSPPHLTRTRSAASRARARARATRPAANPKRPSAPHASWPTAARLVGHDNAGRSGRSAAARRLARSPGALAAVCMHKKKAGRAALGTARVGMGRSCAYLRLSPAPPPTAHPPPPAPLAPRLGPSRGWKPARVVRVRPPDHTSADKAPPRPHPGPGRPLRGLSAGPRARRQGPFPHLSRGPGGRAAAPRGVASVRQDAKGRNEVV